MTFLRELMEPRPDEAQRVAWWIDWAFEHDMTIYEFARGLRDLGTSATWTLEPVANLDGAANDPS